MSVHFSSASDNWATPQAFFDKCAERFGPFDLDVCADHLNHKAPRYFTQADDGLKKSWSLCSHAVQRRSSGHQFRVWMNPPYGRQIGLWMRKAYEESHNKKGVLIVCLVPARTDTAWWHDYAIKGQVEFIRGRLKFGGCKNSAPFPSALVIFGDTTRPSKAQKENK